MGLCKEISNYIDVEDIVEIEIMETETRIFFTNQMTRSYFMPDLSSHIGDKVVLWPTQTTFVHVKVEVKSSCRELEVPWTVEDYNKCIDDQLHGIFSGNFNCTPPWLSTHNQCDGIYSRKYFDNNPTFSKQIVLPLLNFGNNKIEADCRKSCETKHYHVDVRGDTSKGSKHHAYITVDQKVSVTEKVANYSPFQFIIDVGSSLGLWLGLSVLGIHDLVVIALDYSKNSFVFKQFKDLFKNIKA